MYRVSSNFAFHTLAAGEPLALQVQLQDANGDVLDIDDAGLVLTIYTAGTRANVDQEVGERIVDELGQELFAWELNGTRTEALFGKADLRLEIARRLHAGREIYAVGALCVGTSAESVPTLNSEDEFDYAQRVVIRQNAIVGAPVTYIVSTVALNAPTPAPFQTPIGALVACLV